MNSIPAAPSVLNNGNRELQLEALFKTLLTMTLALVLAWIGVRGTGWARRHSRGAIVLLAALFGMVADPTAQRQIESVQESRQERNEADESGEPGPTGGKAQ